MTPAEITALREQLGLLQAEFALISGYGAASRISEIERGVRQPSGPAIRLFRLLRAHPELVDELR